MTDPTAKLATPNQIRAEQLLEDLWRDPQFGPPLRARAKQKFGDIQTPEDVVDPVVAPLRKENQDLKKQLDAVVDRLTKREEREENERAFNEMKASVDTAVSKYGLTEEGRARMLDRMKEMKAYDVEAAAAFVAHSTRPAVTSGPSWMPPKTNFYGAADGAEIHKKLHLDPDGFVDDQMTEFFKDPDKYVSETFGRVA